MIRGKRRPLREPEAAERVTAITARLETGIHNRFDLEVVDARTGALRQKAQALNVVCDALFDRLLTPAAYFSYILYGSGTGTPSASDTALFNRVGSGQPNDSTIVRKQDAAAGWYSIRKHIVLNESTAVGVTLTEVGIGYDSTHCVTHALLRDMNGNPITITKTDTDIITIYATVYCHWNVNGYDGGKITVVPGPTSWGTVDFFNFLCGLGSWGTSKQIAGCAGSMLLSSTKAVTVSYSKANRKITLTSGRWAVGEMNSSNLRYLIIGTSAGLPMQGKNTLALAPGWSGYTPGRITGESIGTGDGATVDFATDFPVGSQCVVYVDGAVESGVSVDEHYPVGGDQIRNHLVGLSPISTPQNHVYLPSPVLNWYHNGNTDNAITCNAGTELIYYNPFYADIGLLSVTPSSSGSTTDQHYCFFSDLFSSDDLQTWIKVLSANNYARYEIPAAERYRKYYKFVVTTPNRGHPPTVAGTSTFTLKNLHFTTPPAAGAVITADYTPDVIAKDSSHVFDFSAEITVGAYTGV